MAFPCHLHGKGAFDTRQGTVKRLAAEAGLRKPYTDKIMTPRQLLNWAQTDMQNMIFEFVTELEFIKEEKLLFQRNPVAKPMHGILKLHALCQYEEVN
jgi:hypothetical protein